METREPVVAGQFYPGTRDACLAEIEASLTARSLPPKLPEPIVAGLVPHAGWTFSGDLAALVFAAVRHRDQAVDTFVIFGTAHGYFGPRPAVDGSTSWRTPLGTAPVAGELRAALLDAELVLSDSAAHRREHSIEVQVPFIQHLFPEARILPIIVPPEPGAVAFGQRVAEVLGAQDCRVIYVGSTDLTHYGPSYGFTPAGAGADGLRWAHEVNDGEFIAAALCLDARRLLSAGIEKQNACGPGAAAAALAAARERGATEGLLLARTSSNEVMQRRMGTTSSDSVGYAAILF
ncbi:MAG: AmmeMemoRadiSam system protein B [Sedimentisphaerales bacterium]|nr:AmmeMemoRadiSam system protein B [Sedimentisphaerales bacterium]